MPARIIAIGRWTPPFWMTVGAFLIGAHFAEPGVEAADVAPSPAATSSPADADEQLPLPPQIELERFADIVARFTGTSLQYPAQKLTGSVRLLVQGPVNRAGAWKIFNQALFAQGFTTVLVGTPPVYQVTPVAEAGNLSISITPEDLKAVTFPPGYVSLVVPLRNLGAETAVKSLGTLAGGQTSTARSLGTTNDRILINAVRDKAEEIARLIAAMDVPGVIPTVHLFRPARTAPATLQTSLSAMWAAAGRIGDKAVPAEIQIAPDGIQLALITASSSIDRLVALAEQLDKAEPVERRTYRPRYFGMDDVANLIQQVLKSGDAGPVEVVKDKLTNSLLITATAAQHGRIDDLLRSLDDAPATARRQLRAFPIKYRSVDEIAKVLGTLLNLDTDGASGPGQMPGQTRDAQPQIRAAATAPTGTSGGAIGGQVNLQTAAPLPDAPAVSAEVHSGGGVSLTTDPVTNRLIVLGDPKNIDQVAHLLEQLDTPQPQVQLEVILVTVSSDQDLTLGTEISSAISRGSLSGNVASLFGLSQPLAGNPVNRVPVAANGLSGVVLNPGDFSVVMRALETINDGRSVIRSQVVTNNNTKATVNGVVQQPLTSLNSSTTVATTSVSGTTDAGTQITITPAISPADHVTLTYTISQSAFLGDSTTTSDGSVIPPAKRADNIASVATIPDSYTIAVGGLSNRTTSKVTSQVPFLGSIPLLGYLFRSERTAETDSRFYVFIRTEVMRNRHFEDLRARSADTRAAAQVADDHPQLAPRITP